MRLVIIESPYSSSNGRTVAQNVAYAKLCVLDSLEQDEAPIASHLLFTKSGLLDDNVPWQREVGIAAGHAWYRRADACVVYTDYGLSEGMKLGILVASTKRVPIEYRKINPKEELPREQESRDDQEHQGAEGDGAGGEPQIGHPWALGCSLEAPQAQAA